MHSIKFCKKPVDVNIIVLDFCVDCGEVSIAKKMADISSWLILYRHAQRIYVFSAFSLYKCMYACMHVRSCYTIFWPFAPH